MREEYETQTIEMYLESYKSFIKIADINLDSKAEVSERWWDFDAVYLPGRVWIVFGSVLQFVELIEFDF